jgi:cell division ATPase FtsA
VSRQKAKGTAFERLVADYLSTALNDDRIDRMPLRGGADRGDIAGIRTALGERIAVEVKNHSRLDLAGWISEAEVERGNAYAAVGVVIHKRRGKGQAADQYVTLTLGDLAVLLGGTR